MEYTINEKKIDFPELFIIFFYKKLHFMDWPEAIWGEPVWADAGGFSLDTGGNEASDAENNKRCF